MSTAAVILAAGLGTRLRPFTKLRPKCLVPIGGRLLLEQVLGTLGAADVAEVVVVVGYRGDLVAREAKRISAGPGTPGVRCVPNEGYARTGTAASLATGIADLDRDGWRGDVIVAEGDIWFDNCLLDRLAADPAPNVVAVDRPGVGGEGSLLRLGPDRRVLSWHFLPNSGPPPDGELFRLGNVYRFGAESWSGALLPALREAVAERPQLPLEVALQGAGSSGLVTIIGVPVSDCRWWEIDTAADLRAATARCIDGAPAEEATRA